MAAAYFQIPDDSLHTALNTSVFLLEQQTLVDKLAGLHRQISAHARLNTSLYQVHKKHALVESIGELEALEANWDGEGSSPIAPAAIARAISLLSVMAEALPLPEFSPNPNGTLSLYWTVPHGSAELEIGRTRHSWAIVDRAGKVTTLCSGDNRAFESPASLMDLLSALTPARTNFGTDPLTHLVMRHEWDEVADSL